MDGLDAFLAGDGNGEMGARTVNPAGRLNPGERKSGGFFLMAARFARARLGASGTLKVVHHDGGDLCVSGTRTLEGFFFVKEWVVILLAQGRDNPCPYLKVGTSVAYRYACVL